jgi:hypothetical protein
MAEVPVSKFDAAIDGDFHQKVPNTYAPHAPQPRIGGMTLARLSQRAWTQFLSLAE